MTTRFYFVRLHGRTFRSHYSPEQSRQCRDMLAAKIHVAAIRQRTKVWSPYYAAKLEHLEGSELEAAWKDVPQRETPRTLPEAYYEAMESYATPEDEEFRDV